MGTDCADIPKAELLAVIGQPIKPQANVVNDKLFSMSFDDYALNGKSKEMAEKMKSDTYILKELAIAGQMTVFYAAPNTGKTLIILKMLIDSIRRRDVKAEYVYFINADDNGKGMITKLEIAEEHGFKMLSPNFEGFSVAVFEGVINHLVGADDCAGKVVILDTVKKFTDIMNKQASTMFGTMMRSFSSKGGSVIMLAHTNKNRDGEGKRVFAGTSDLLEDCDCSYIMDVASTDTPTGTEKLVTFENNKQRGDVAQKLNVYYRSVQGMDYRGLMATVEIRDESEAKKLMQSAHVEQSRKDNIEIITAIIETIEEGTTLKTEIINSVAHSIAVSRPKVKKVLEKHIGGDYMAGYRWEHAQRNAGDPAAAKRLKLIPPAS
ncbi:AAA family ATPase [Shewanella sp. SG41-4]|uniref:AAA family ATPase n=1 Tax=Shewanella sp. SG41-4 TaxID=2760976 RepID=UPI00160361D3|nr:AAA family ATPase [Shewanella sp. SG41-4]MBB1440291.1 AAA family ATPase [Shewanella sp. SG41-4]